MWLSSFLLIAAFSGVLSYRQMFEDELLECARGIQGLDFQELAKKRNDVQMAILCPKVFEAIRCADEPFKTRYSATLKEFADVYGGPNGILIQFMANTMSMLTDLCTNGNQLNKDFKAENDCWRSIDSQVLNQCKLNSSESRDIYRLASNALDKQILDSYRTRLIFEGNCQESAAMAVCLADLIKDNCGQRAFNTFITMVGRTTLFRYMKCTNDEMGYIRLAVGSMSVFW